MLVEEGEKRVFLPNFIHWLAKQGLEICLEQGYGYKLGFDLFDYQVGGGKVFEGTREEAFRQDVVMILRSPVLEEFEKMQRGGILISMLHYHTRPRRVQVLEELGINAISLDSIINDNSIRLVENMRAVAWNGLDAAFGVLEKEFPSLRRGNGHPFKVLIMGTGMVGRHAFDAASKLGDRARNEASIAQGGVGAVVMGIGRNLTANPDALRNLLTETDILVDTTLRDDPSKLIIPNAWLADLPSHAVIVDLAVDPYTLDVNSPVMPAIEGIPQGNLDQYIFFSDNPNWNEKIPAGVATDVRRTSISCYSWPGIHPMACMEHYQGQLQPLMRILLARGYDELSLRGTHFERAMLRGTLRFFEGMGNYPASICAIA